MIKVSLIIWTVFISLNGVAQFGKDSSNNVQFDENDIVHVLENFLVDSNFVLIDANYELKNIPNIDNINLMWHYPNGSKALSISFIDNDVNLSRYSEETLNNLGYKIMPKKFPHSKRENFRFCNCQKRIEINMIESDMAESNEWEIVIKRTISEEPKYEEFSNQCSCSN